MADNEWIVAMSHLNGLNHLSQLFACLHTSNSPKLQIPLIWVQLRSNARMHALPSPSPPKKKKKKKKNQVKLKEVKHYKYNSKQWVLTLLTGLKAPAN